MFCTQDKVLITFFTTFLTLGIQKFSLTMGSVDMIPEWIDLTCSCITKSSVNFHFGSRGGCFFLYNTSACSRGPLKRKIPLWSINANKPLIFDPSGIHPFNQVSDNIFNGSILLFDLKNDVVTSPFSLSYLTYVTDP